MKSTVQFGVSIVGSKENCEDQLRNIEHELERNINRYFSKTRLIEYICI